MGKIYYKISVYVHQHISTNMNEIIKDMNVYIHKVFSISYSTFSI